MKTLFERLLNFLLKSKSWNFRQITCKIKESSLMRDADSSPSKISGLNTISIRPVPHLQEIWKILLSHTITSWPNWFQRRNEFHISKQLLKGFNFTYLLRSIKLFLSSASCKLFPLSCSSWSWTIPEWKSKGKKWPMNAFTSVVLSSTCWGIVSLWHCTWLHNLKV